MTFSIELSSPNHLSRNNNPINVLLLKSAVGDAKEVLDSFLHPKSEESSHYLIDEKGVMYRLVPESRASLCTGFSFWRNTTDIDLSAISITLVTQEAGFFNHKQIETLIGLAKEKTNLYEIPPQNIVSACDVSFLIHSDFGFPWQELASEGIGLWPNDDEGTPSQGNLLEILGNIGYKINVQSYKMAILAFQKHFMPDHTTGEEDEKTIRRANAVYRLFSETPEIR